MPGPLAGIRVIDLTSVVMGPYATQILGDMGAEVIKVESPEGDVFRYVAPYRNRGMSAAFLNLNRNKRSISLDLKKPADRQHLLDLAARADVLVSTIRPQALRKMGLDYEALQRINPRLIYCAAYGFSERGPYAGRPAFDDIIQAISGLAALEGHEEPSGPRFVNTIMADKTTGLTIAYAVAMALFEREKSGLGQAIEVPMFETMVSFNLIEHLAGETYCPAEATMGYDRILSKHRRPHRTLDGYIGLLPYTTEQWRRFFDAAGRPDLAADPRFIDPSLRSQNIDALYGLLAELIAQRTTDDWVRVLHEADIPATKVLSLDDLLEDEHLESIGFFTHEKHATEGDIRNVGIPVHFSRTPGDVRRLAPNLDENHAEILAELKEK